MRLSLTLLILIGCESGSAEITDAETDSDSTDLTDVGDDDDDDDDDDDTIADGALAGWCTDQSDDFSFFVTSMSALWALSGDDISNLDGGFGGDLGGISGADQICQSIGVATGHGDKTWRAYLSAADDGSGSPVDAIDRIGSGPWYDANGRLVASGLSGLANQTRPDGDAQSVDDLPDECGVPLSALGDAHDVITGSDVAGELDGNTCSNWTSLSGDRVTCGHSFPREGGGPGGGPGGGDDFGAYWGSDHPVPGCAKGATLTQGAGVGDCIGCSGGYGAIYCFAE